MGNITHDLDTNDLDRFGTNVPWFQYIAESWNNIHSICHCTFQRNIHTIIQLQCYKSVSWIRSKQKITEQLFKLLIISVVTPPDYYGIVIILG